MPVITVLTRTHSYRLILYAIIINFVPHLGKQDCCAKSSSPQKKRHNLL
jgi:hypothetical protein